MNEAESLPPLPEPKLYPSGTYPDGVLTYSADQMLSFARQAVAAERERCAKVCERIFDDPEGNNGYVYYTRPYLECAEEIRSGK